MKYTEEEARAMWCPTVENRCCFGSKCVAWIWVEWKHDEYIFKQARDESSVPYKGKCGMVKYE